MSRAGLERLRAVTGRRRTRLASLRSRAGDRLLLLRTLRAAGPRLLSCSVALQLTVSLVPAGTALATGLVVDRVARATAADVLTAVVPGLAVLAGVILAGYAAQEFAGPVDYLTVQRVDGAQRARLTSLATRSRTIDALEEPDVAELVRTARADPQSWSERTPGQGALAQLHLPVRWAGVAASCTVLACFAWWLVPLVLLPAVAARSVWRRQIAGHVSRQRLGGADAVRAEGWKNLAIDATGGKEVRTFGLADFALEQAARHRLRVSAPRWESEARGAALQWVIALIVGPPLAAVYVLVAGSAVRDTVSVALLTAVFSAAWSVLRAMGPRDAFDVEGALPAVRAVERLEPLLGGPAEERHPSLGGPPEEAGPPLIRFDGVSFGYRGAGRPVLDRLDLELRPGELLALVGLNGAGKSTLIKLLCGLHLPCEGRITADGTDLSDMSPEAWHARLAVIWQDFIQYPLTAEENVRLGRPACDAPQEALEAAAAAAGLTSLVERLPRGWHTPLSRSRNGGVDLSGGEWQQVMLARALYAVHAGAQVLVMDEPTAHLDVRAEFEVFQRLAAQRGHRSVLLISHRLSTVRDADRIVLLDEGRITECGTHEELMDLGGAYARLFTLQAERFRLDAENLGGTGPDGPGGAS